MLSASLHELPTRSHVPSRDFFPCDEVPCKGHHQPLKPETWEPPMLRPPLTPSSPRPLSPSVNRLFHSVSQTVHAFTSLHAAVTAPRPRRHRFPAGLRDRLLPPTAVGVCPSAPHPLRLVLPRDKGPDPDGPRGPGRAPSRLAVAARPVSVCPSSLPVPGAGPSALCQEKPRLFAPGDLAWNTSVEHAGPTPLSFLCRPPRFSRPPPPQL